MYYSKTLTKIVICDRINKIKEEVARFQCSPVTIFAESIQNWITYLNMDIVQSGGTIALEASGREFKSLYPY